MTRNRISLDFRKGVAPASTFDRAVVPADAGSSSVSGIFVVGGQGAMARSYLSNGRVSQDSKNLIDSPFRWKNSYFRGTKRISGRLRLWLFGLLFGYATGRN